MIVLVTGMSGLIGTAMRRELDPARYELRSLSRREVPGVVNHRADIADLEAIAPAFTGVDAVVHLAADVRLNPPFEELRPTAPARRGSSPCGAASATSSG